MLVNVFFFNNVVFKIICMGAAYFSGNISFLLFIHGKYFLLVIYSGNGCRGSYLCAPLKLILLLVSFSPLGTALTHN